MHTPSLRIQPLARVRQPERSGSPRSPHPPPCLPPLCSSPRAQANLSLLHACLHCRASKTACTDQRPCTRCRRLGLECSLDLGQPRKRACRCCHSAKVACGASFTDACPRCKRLGLECVPRDPPVQGPRRKRVRAEIMHSQNVCLPPGGFEGFEGFDAHALAAFSGVALAGPAPVPLPPPVPLRQPLGGALLVEKAGTRTMGMASPARALAEHLAPLDLNTANPAQWTGPAFVGVGHAGSHAATGRPSSPRNVSSMNLAMISVASSLLELSQPSGAPAQTEAVGLPRSPALVGAAAWLGALSASPIPQAALPTPALAFPVAAKRNVDTLFEKLNARANA